MADNRSPMPSLSSRDGAYADPFSDRPPRQTHFDDPEPLSDRLATPMPRPFDSTTSLTHEPAHDMYDEDDEYIEKQPLNVGQSFTGGFYPPP